MAKFYISYKNIYIMLETYLNKDFYTEINIKKLNKEFNEASFFPHISIDNMFKKEILLDLKNELKKEDYYFEECDLYTFFKTNDLKNSNSLLIKNFRNFLMSEEFLIIIEKISNLTLIKNKLDFHSLKFLDTHYLLCHNDMVLNRKIAFVINLSDLKIFDGASLNFFSSKKDNENIENLNILDNKYCVGDVFKSIVPKFGRFNMFLVSQKSFHSVSELISDKERISFSGWWF